MNPDDLKPLPADNWAVKLQLVKVDEPHYGQRRPDVQYMVLTFRVVGTKYVIYDHLAFTESASWKIQSRAQALTTDHHLEEMKKAGPMDTHEVHQHFRRMLNHTCQGTLVHVAGTADFSSHWRIQHLRKAYSKKRWNGHQDRRPSMGRK